MKKENHITEAKHRNGFLGRLDRIKAKIKLTIMLLKSDRFFAIDVSTNKEGRIHFELLSFQSPPPEIKNVCVAIAQRIQGMEDAERETQNILNNLGNAN
jgi:hypothetical protein